MEAPLSSRSLIHQTPPDPRSRLDNNPTLLVSWWATGFSLVFILVRVCGRYVRVERFFPEDLIMMASVVPLLIRMAFVHVILLYGTNNTKTAGLSPSDIHHRVIGSKLVLAARIFFAIYIWTAKFTICEFLKRLSGMIWRRSLQVALQMIYYFLASTLIAVVIATLAECQPFDHYWQVIPDPGMNCRAGYANLITMGTCDVITDLLLVAFPIPIVLMTNMPVKRKIALALSFALSLILVAITLYRVPMVIFHHGSQQYRSLLASLEILAATAVSNAVVIGSFVRDRGVKKLKFNKGRALASVSENMDETSIRRATITHHQWGSDSDLAGDLGIRLQPKLYSHEGNPPPVPPIAPPYHSVARAGALDPNWSFKRHSMGSEDSKVSAPDSLDVKVSPHEYIETTKTPRKKSGDTAVSSTRRVSFCDVGGLLGQDLDPELGSVSQNSRAGSANSIPSPSPRFRRSSIQQIPPSARLSPVPDHHSPGQRSPLPRSPGPSPAHQSPSADSNYFDCAPSSTSDSAPPSSAGFDNTGPIMEGDDVELQDVVGGLLNRR